MNILWQEGGLCPNCGHIEDMGNCPEILGPFLEDGNYGVRCQDCGVEVTGQTPEEAKQEWIKMKNANQPLVCDHQGRAASAACSHHGPGGPTT